MAKETKNPNAEAVAEAVSRTELFFKENSKPLVITVAVIIILAVGFFLWHKFAYEPARAEAQEQMYPAENNFRNAEYELALNGDGNVLGFAQIIDEYGAKAGKSVYFYAGVCELQLGNYESAAEYLRKYSGKDRILAGRALSCLGDAYVGLEDYAQAVECFMKAAKVSDDMFSAAYLLKAGVTWEELGDDAKALACYNDIKDNYPPSMEAYDIDKYISRIEAKAE